MALISLKRASDNEPIAIEESNIIIGYDSTNGTKIEYINPFTGYVNIVEVAETSSSISTVSTSLILLSFELYPSDKGLININRILNMWDNSSSKAVISYDRGTQQKGRYVMNVDRTAVLVAMYTKQGYLSYAVESYSGLDIVFPAALGDISAKFQNGEVLTIFGALDENNGTYIVDSVAHAVGQTTVTLDTIGVSDDADTTGYVMVKA
ncbi:MAG: hypothetical protein KDC67_14405 [Ignavibacteriae bacterium]|nr:hypothetical protein [Ignavibacteriota bacterium]